MDENRIFSIVLFFLVRKNVFRKMLPLISFCQLFVRCVGTSYNNDLVSVSRIFSFLSHIPLKHGRNHAFPIYESFYSFLKERV